MTPKQQRFVEEYLLDLNATQAAIRAGVELKASGEGFYVYALVDLRDGAIFYIGKGKRNRVTQHRLAARTHESTNQVKASRIRECGQSLGEFILFDGLDEMTAYRVEKEMIGSLRDHGLTNISSGTIHPVEAEIAKIDASIALIRPYEEWLRVARPDQLVAAASLNGSTRAFYDKFVESFADLRRGAEARLKSIREKSNGAARR